MKEYTYRVVSKYRKDKGLDKLAEFGFNPYCEGEVGVGKPSIYAARVILDKTSSFVTRLVKMIYKAYSSKDLDEKDKAEFKENFQEGANILTEKAINDLTNAMLCFFVDDGELFLNIDGVEYHSSVDINEACPRLVSALVDKGVAYKKKVGLSYKSLTK